MLAKIPNVIEMTGWQTRSGRADLRQSRLAENLGGGLSRSSRRNMHTGDLPSYSPERCGHYCEDTEICQV